MPDTVPRSQESTSSQGQSQLFTRDFLEVALVFALILIALWSGPRAQKMIGIATFCWIVISTLRSQPTADALGLRLRGIRRSLWIVCAALLFAALAIWIASRMHTLHVVLFHGFAVESSVLAYMLWALVQQFILQDFFLAAAAPAVAHERFGGGRRRDALRDSASAERFPDDGHVSVGTRSLRVVSALSQLVFAGSGARDYGLVPGDCHSQRRTPPDASRAGLLQVATPAAASAQPKHHMASTDAWVTADATSRRSSRHARP